LNSVDAIHAKFEKSIVGLSELSVLAVSVKMKAVVGLVVKYLGRNTILHCAEKCPRAHKARVPNARLYMVPGCYMVLTVLCSSINEHFGR
jgi:hypothetical protein